MNPFNILWRSFCNTQSLKTFQVEGTQLSKLGLVQRNKSRTLLFSFHQHITSVRNLSLQRTAISNLPLLLIQFPWKSHKLFPSQSSFCKIEVSDSKEKESNRKPGPGPSISIKKAHYPGEFCWSCKHHLEPKNTLFCNNCEKILPTSETDDYFSLFLFPRKFELDEKKLDKHYQSLLRRVHPDRFQLKTKDELKISETNSSHLNQAYKILKDPIERVKYLVESILSACTYFTKLKLEGIDVGEGAGTIDDQELLMEILELQEKLEEGVSEAELRIMHSQNSEKLRNCFEVIRKAYDEKKDLGAVKKEAIKVQYFGVLQKQIEAKLPVS